jgi:ferrous iron transport protein A
MYLLAFANKYKRGVSMTLIDAIPGQVYIIKSIQTDDEELDSFLFTLGCYSGEPITVIQHLKNGCVIAIKDARYSIDKQLAQAILI